MDYFALIVVFMVAGYLLDLYVDLRQHRCYAVREIPAEVQRLPALASKVTPESFLKSQDYGRAKSAFGLLSSAFDVAFTLAVLYTGGLRWVWDASRAALEGAGLDMRSGERPNEVLHSLAFAAGCALASHAVSLPWTLYGTFVIEQRYGYNKTTWRLFVVDQLKIVAVAVAIGAPVLSVLVFLLSRSGQYFWLYVWFFLMAVTVLMMILYPVVLLPLFNVLTPLEDGELRDAVGRLAQSLSFPFSQVLVMDGSKRSGHSNAFFAGLGSKKRIVLYDTLISQLTVPELIGVLAHEIGHNKRRHLYKLFAITNAYQLLFLYMLGRFINDRSLYQAFGFGLEGEYCPVLVGFTLFAMVYSPVDTVFHPLINAISRTFEYEADRFAAPHEGIETALAKLHVENSSSLVVDPLYSTLHYSHPTILERLRALDQLKAKNN
eukprot:m51a1_g12039 putative STE24 endopeptidase (434) ;mRNA; f:62-1711